MMELGEQRKLVSNFLKYEDFCESILCEVLREEKSI